MLTGFSSLQCKEQLKFKFKVFLTLETQQQNTYKQTQVHIATLCAQLQQGIYNDEPKHLIYYSNQIPITTPTHYKHKHENATHKQPHKLTTHMSPGTQHRLYNTKIL